MFMTTVTGITLKVRWMTSGAGDRSTFAMVQGEGMLSIECSWRPGSRTVTGTTVCAKFTGVLSGFSMTGNTSCIQSFKLAILMAILTSHIHMFTCQRKIGTAVIKIRILPFGWIMTGGTIRTELTFMFILIFMTGITILRGVDKVSQSARTVMTFLASRTFMPAFQLECKTGMAKSFAKFINPIVTIETERSVRTNMRRGKDRVYLTVAAFAGVRCKSGDVILMTIRAGERFILNCQLVRFQRESQRLMRKCVIAQIRQRGGSAAMLRMTATTGK